eukprot:TRINITY_DN32497_c0_g1_i1.p1 TRINITY_DN32497_c0_g1~~TRINITY_DN32497_c0_g1_i1.p1  ORF type:complete len:1014 (-),score=99.71 TRINITY_DN32497_c0_g1_i1:542-3271(-)
MLFRSCPYGFVISPGKCGSIVHHDVKFDNVIVGVSRDKSTSSKAASNDYVPQLIDFGGASWCNEGKSDTFSQNWAPIWLVDPTKFLSRECWSYDIYTVGVMWLVTELLATLPSAQLFCDEALRQNLVDVSDITFANSPSAQKTRRVRTCPSFNVDYSFRQKALESLSMLVEGLHKYVFNEDALQDEKTFMEAVEQFIYVAPNVLEDEYISKLPLVAPPASIGGQIFDMLKECPEYPVQTWTHSESKALFEQERAFCNLRRALRRLHNVPVANASLSSDVMKRRADVEDAWHKLPDLKAKVATTGESYLLLQRIFVAIITGDVRDAKQLLHSSPKSARTKVVRSELPHGETLLASAARSGSLEIVEALLAEGADPLQVDILRGDFDAVRKAGGLNVPLCAVLAAATRPDNLLVLEALVNRLDDVEYAAMMGMKHLDAFGPKKDVHAVRRSMIPSMPTLWEVIVRLGSADMLQGAFSLLNRYLDSADNDVATRDEYGTLMYAALKVAVMYNRGEAVERMISWGMKTKFCFDSGDTILSMASRQGHVSLVRTIANMDPSLLQSVCSQMFFSMKVFTDTPLHVAIDRKDVETVKALAELGASLSVRNLQGATPIDMAVQSGSSDIVHLVLGLLPSCESWHHALISSIRYSQTAVALQLLSVDVSRPCDLDPSVLAMSAAKANTLVVKALLGEGMSPHAWYKSDLLKYMPQTSRGKFLLSPECPLMMLVGHHCEELGCAEDSIEVLSMLSEHSDSAVLAKQRSPDGINALGQAAFNGDVQRFSFLMDRFGECSTAIVPTRRSNDSLDDTFPCEGVFGHDNATLKAWCKQQSRYGIQHVNGRFRLSAAGISLPQLIRLRLDQLKTVPCTATRLFYMEPSNWFRKLDLERARKCDELRNNLQQFQTMPKHTGCVVS